MNNAAFLNSQTTCAMIEAKNRYLYLLPDNKKHKKELIKLCKLNLKNEDK